jgi:MFS family permease
MSFTLNKTTLSLLSIYIPSLIMSFGMGMLAPAVPLLAVSFGVSVGLAAQILTAQMVGRILTVMPAGMMVDTLGRKPVMVMGASVLALGSIAAAFTPSFLFLIGSRFIQGVGGSLWGIAREVAAMDLVRPEQRGRAMSIFFGMTHVGMAMGPVFGGVITDLMGFRALFLIYAGLAVGVLFISMTIKETRVKQPRRAGSPFAFPKLSELDAYFRMTFLILIFATFTMMVRGTVMNSMLPLYVGMDLGYSATQIGSLFGVAGLVNAAMIVPAGFLSDKIARKAATVPASALTGIAFIVFFLADNLILLYVASAIYGLGIGLSSGSLTTSTFDLAPEGGMARFQSLRRFSAEIGMLAGPPSAGFIANAYSPRAVFLFFAPLYLISAFLLAVVARETHPKRRAKIGSDSSPTHSS